jgi:hypothetical protein
MLILATASVVYSHTNSNGQIYAQVELQNSTAGVKITSPATSQKVPVGQLIVLGTSTDNSTTDCQVYVDLNDIKPMQNTTAAGAGGQNDYSNWTFTYTSKYRLIAEGVNELTAKLSCIDNPANVTKYYSVNVTGVAATTNTNNTNTITSNATLKNVTTENNNQPELSADPVNQTQKQTLQIQSEPNQELQTESLTDSVPQPLKETQQEEVQPESIPYDKNSESITSEVVPLDDSPYSSDELSEGSNEAVDVEKSTELVEPAMELPNYASDQVQIDEDELQPMETQSQPQETLEQQPLVGQEVVPEIIGQQPLEDSQPLETMNQPQGSLEQQPLETLESSQPMEDLPVESFSQETQPSQSEIQPLDQQPLEDSQPLETMNQPQGSLEQQPLETLESSQPIEDLPVESFSQETQPSQSEIQPLDQQPPFSEQQEPESTTHVPEQLTKGVNEVEQPSLKDQGVPFVLPFDSHDVTPNS